MIETSSAKLRYLVATNRRPLQYLGVALLIVGVLGVVLTLLFPPMVSVTEVTDRAVIETRTNTSTTVTGDHAMYDAGEQLTNEPVYVRSVSPSVTVGTTTRAPPDGVEIDTRISVVYEAASVEDGVFRQQRHALDSASGTIGTGGDTIETTVELTIADVAEARDEMQAEIGDSGRVNAHLHVETTYSGPGYEGTVEDQVRMRVTPDSYRIPTLTVTEEHSSTTSVRRPAPDEVFEVTLPAVGTVVVPHYTPIFGVLALLGGGIYGAVRHGRTEFDADREQVRIHRLRYDEWISTGHLPPALANHTIVVPVDSLESLVDVAIDSRTRVIHDPDQDCYAVLTSTAVFVFYPDESGEFMFDNVVRDADA